MPFPIRQPIPSARYLQRVYFNRLCHLVTGHGSVSRHRIKTPNWIGPFFTRTLPLFTMVAQFNMVASLALLVTSAIASPVRRQSDDNGSCNEMMTICAQASDALTNPWKTPACLFGAACFGGQRPVDGFLAALCATKNGNSCSSSGAPTALDSPRVSSNVCHIHQTMLSLNFISYAGFRLNFYRWSSYFAAELD